MSGAGDKWASRRDEGIVPGSKVRAWGELRRGRLAGPREEGDAPGTLELHSSDLALAAASGSLQPHDYSLI